MNTQGMSGTGSFGVKITECGPLPAVKHSIFTPEEREELKSIMIDALTDLQGVGLTD